MGSHVPPQASAGVIGDGLVVAAWKSVLLGVFSLIVATCMEGGVANLCFGGVDGTELLMLNETRAFVAKMCYKGALHSVGGGALGS